MDSDSVKENKYNTVIYEERQNIYVCVFKYICARCVCARS